MRLILLLCICTCEILLVPSLPVRVKDGTWYILYIYI